MTSEELTEEIKKKIINWYYSPSQGITEKSICQEYNISRSPVRESLKRLEGEGYIEKIPKVGYRVIQLNPNQTRQLYDVRLALELFVVESLALNRQWDEQIENLKLSWTNESNFLNKNGAYWADLDRNFHETLALLAGNTILLENLKSINDRLHIFRNIEFSQAPPKAEEHLAILEAIKEGCVVDARMAVSQNIITARDKVEEIIKVVLARSVFSGGVEND